MKGPTPKERALLEKIYSFFHKVLPSLELILIIALGTGIGGALVVFAIGLSVEEPFLSDTSAEISADKDDCNVLGINLHGTLWTYILQDGGGLLADKDAVSSEDILYYIDKAEKDEKIKAILVEVDSSGGVPVAGEEIAGALGASVKPTVGLIRQMGISA